MSNHWREERKKTYYSSRPFRRMKSTDVSSSPAPPFGKLIQSLNQGDLEEDAQRYLDRASIQDCELVASYNWLDRGEAAMIVPGKPPRWTPQSGVVKLPQDKGDYFRDKNASRYPVHLMESTILAALSLCPDLPANVDIVGCYSSLGNLLRFLLGKDKSFRILVQVVGSTVLLVRRENSPIEKIEGIKGHGHTFPEAYTTWDNEVKGSDTSHRILKYRFGGLRLLVRSEVDAYVANEDEDVISQSSRAAEKKSASARSSTTTTTTDITGLNALVSSLGPTTHAPPTTSTPAKIAITTNPSSGTQVPQSQIVEIKTRWVRKRDTEDTAAEEMPKLWLARIPNFVVAYHDSGTFEADIKVQNVKLRVDRWEKMAKRELAALAALLHRVIRIVRERGDRKIELCRNGAGELEIREQCADAGELLSEETKATWTRDAQLSKETEVASEDEGAELDVGDDVEWGDKDWTHCSAECGYCGSCKK